jgi:phospholipid-binding lipoprotein MlaA
MRMPTIRCRGTILLVLALGVGARLADADEVAGAPARIPEGIAPANAAADAPDLLSEEPEAETYEPAAPISDPLEPANRAFFGLNRKLDAWFWSPLTRAYRFVAPEPARRGIRRAFRNLNTPIFFVNNVLQLRLRDAGETLGAFALNSTLGILGLLEPSREAGWEPRPADFGQTLALVGVGKGPYLVMPILGPTTLRDGIGTGVDRFFQPLSYVIPIVPMQLLWGGGAGLSLRDEASDHLAELERSSVDFYAVMRSAYAQNRAKEVAEARERRDAQLSAIVPESWRRGEGGEQAAQD